MAIAVWVLKAPMPVGPGLWATELQLREVTLRFPADAPAGGLLAVAFIDKTGREVGERLLHALSPEDMGRLGRGCKAVASFADELLRALDVLPEGAARLTHREYEVPAPPSSPASPVTAPSLGALG